VGRHGRGAWFNPCKCWYDIVISEIVKPESAPLRPSALLALQCATHATLHLIATELVDLGLTASEINALANLADGQGRTISRLGAAVGARPTTLTSVLDRLKRCGHLSRGARADDRRSALIELTDSGREAAAVIARTLADLEHRALKDLAAEAIAGFHAVLNALTEEGS
jgi:DNA-binding MarR family transcriptional regulator